MNFDEAFDILLDPQHEGTKVSNNPNDRGGLTRFGISQRSYPNVDIQSLTREQAKQIYARDFWAVAGCDNPHVPDDIKFDLFDTAVNSGPKQAIRLLQKAAGVPVVDGVLGAQTIDYLSRLQAWRVCVRFAAARLMFMTTCKDWQAFGAGWTNRVANNLLRL